jgi:hypothetical protein
MNLLTQGLPPTWNISPAPSQSLAVMMGVCTYRNPDSWKNLRSSRQGQADI